MGVYIKGMEMPKSCNACMFDVYGLCLINKNIEGKDELTHSCPLVHVPDHGRLIDAEGNVGVNVRMMPGGKCEVDLIAPTIIPASEEGET